MSRYVRALVGTLHTEENEIEACLASIRAQKGAAIEHFLVEGLPKRQAHERLYGTFMERAAEFAFFVKVDADMVLASEDVLARIFAAMTRRSEILDLGVAVEDFFSRRLMIGLHTYRSSVVWPKAEESLFTDHSPVPRSARMNDYEDLAPAAMHSPDPSPFQAFHYGLHRGVKLVAVREGRAPGTGPRKGHARNRELTWQGFLDTADLRRGWASLGFELAIRGDLGAADIDYGNERARRAWERYRSLGRRDLEERIRRLRRTNDRELAGKEPAGAGTAT